MIDTHSHIYGPEFSQDIAEVVSRAKDAGVERILLPNIDKDSVRQMNTLCRQYPGYMFPMMGLHPTDVGEDYLEQLTWMQTLLDEPCHPYIAIGEVGLDFYWDTTFAVQQRDAFRRQVEWAVRYGLPLMIHTRAAHAELLRILDDYREENLTGVFHCFGGTLEEAWQLLSFNGFVLGVGGVVTYKKSALPEVLKEIPLNRIVLETDSPYLAPSPHRGKRNESSYLAYIVARVAEIYKVPAKEVEKATNENVSRIFHSLR